MRRLLILSLFPLLFSFTMCGKRGSPLPPFTKVPSPPSKVLIQQQGNKVVLLWEKVTTYKDGRKLPLPDKVYYLVSVNFGRKNVKTNKNFLKDPVEKLEEKRCYSVAAVYEGKRSSFTEPICIFAKEPIKDKPKIIRYEGGDGKVTFTFSPHSMKIEVFKNGNEPYFSPYKVVKPNENSFTDRKVLNGKTYLYRFRFGSGVYKGELTKSYDVTPEDRIPPLPPKNPLLLPSKEGCLLVWEPSTSRDLNGYLLTIKGKTLKLPKTAIYFQLKTCPNKVEIRAFDKFGNLSKPVTVRRER